MHRHQPAGSLFTRHHSFQPDSKAMNASEPDAMHQDPDNWRLMFFYFSPQDPRIVVRRRRRAMGWTLNFAWPLAFPVLLALIGGVSGSMELLNRLALSGTSRWTGIFTLMVLAVPLCGWLANPRHCAK